MQSLSTDIDSIGGGMGGGSNQLLWLLLLLKDGGLNGNSGADSAKLDCLAQGQETIRAQAADNNISAQFNNLSNEIRGVATSARDSRDLTTTQLTTLAQSLASCCCDLKTGQQSIETAIAMQTNTLLVNENNNTQRILDELCANQAAIKDAEIRSLQDRLQTQTIIAQCGGKGNAS